MGEAGAGAGDSEGARVFGTRTGTEGLADAETGGDLDGFAEGMAEGLADAETSDDLDGFNEGMAEGLAVGDAADGAKVGFGFGDTDGLE